MQKQRILEYLQNGGTLTSYESFILFGDTRLPDKIYRLKKDGYVFSTTEEKRINRHGEIAYFKRYKLEGKNV